MATQDKAMSIAVVVVTFNRKALLIECLNALLKQEQSIDQIYLIDNASIDGTPELLREEGLLEHPLIHYVRLAENTGGAGGFYEGIKLASEAGHHWIWVMDDDAEPNKDALLRLVSCINENGKSQYSGICGKVVGVNGEAQYAHRGNFSSNDGQVPIPASQVNMEQEVSYASFVGLLINGAAIHSAGYPLKEFFIWFDDVEYCQRLVKFGPILYQPKSEILHKDNVLNTNEQAKNLKWPPKIPFNMQWKFLCGFRNSIFLMMQHGNKDKFWALGALLKKIVRISLADDHKFKLIYFYSNYWLQGIGVIPFKTIKPAEWNALK